MGTEARRRTEAVVARGLGTAERSTPCMLSEALEAAGRDIGSVVYFSLQEPISALLLRGERAVATRRLSQKRGELKQA